MGDECHIYEADSMYFLFFGLIYLVGLTILYLALYMVGMQIDTGIALIYYMLPTLNILASIYYKIKQWICTHNST